MRRGVKVDVSCAQCGTEYEFDETLLSPAGTPVRCGQCQFAFRVHPSRPVAGGWTVKRDDGIHVQIASLTELRERIRRGELAETDLIARRGESYKPLGDILELESTFAAARTGKKPVPLAAPPRRDYEVTARQGSEAMAARGVASRASHPTVQQVRPPMPAVPEPEPKPGLSLAFDDDTLPVRRRSRAPLFALLVAVIVVATLVAAYRAQVEGLAQEREAAARAVTSSLATDTYDAYRDAVNVLADLHARDADDLVPLERLALTESRWAEALRDEAAAESDAGGATTLRSLADEHAAEARRFADAAVARDPGSSVAAQARLHASLADGSDTAGAVLAVPTTDDADVLRMLDLARARGDGAAIVAASERAADRTPSDARPVATLLSRAIAAHDAAAVARLLPTLRSRSAEHPLALLGERALARSAPQDAGVP